MPPSRSAASRLSRPTMSMPVLPPSEPWPGKLPSLPVSKTGVVGVLSGVAGVEVVDVGGIIVGVGVVGCGDGVFVGCVGVGCDVGVCVVGGTVGVGVFVGVGVGVTVTEGVGVTVSVGVGVGVGVGVSHPVTQNTLCLTSAPCAPSAWMVSLTW
jgi:hypothetical protein